MNIHEAVEPAFHDIFSMLQPTYSHSIMKTIKLAFFVSLLIASLVFPACLPESIYLDELKEFDSIDELFDLLDEPSQNFSVKAQDGAILTADQGTILDIPADAFVDASGDLVKGEVSVLLTEYYKKSEMMFGGLQTMSDGQLLYSAGSFYLEFRVGQEQVFSNPSAPIAAFLPLDENDRDLWNRMQWFEGEMNPANEMEAINWTVDSSTSIVVIQDSALQNGQFLRAYQAFGDVSGWRNCDVFSDIPAELKVDIVVEILGEEEEAHSIVYLFFTGRRALIQLDLQSDGSYVVGGEAIPIGEEGSLVAVSVGKEEDDLRYGIADIKIERDGKYEVLLNDGTVEELQKTVQGLDDL